MFSKLIRRVLFIGLVNLFLLITGCSYFFNLDQRESKINYKSESGQCTNSVNESIKRYFDRVKVPPVTTRELDQVYDCYRKSLESFVRYTKSGRLDSDSYSAENISFFLKKFYPDLEEQISLDDIRYYLSLKSFLIGGQSDSLSKSEILKISDFLSGFIESLKTLLPYRSVYFRKANLKKDKKDYDYYSKALKVLKGEIDKLLEFFPYQNLNSTLNLRLAIQFIERENNNTRNLDHFSDLIIAFKNLSVLSEGDLVKRKDFNFFVKQSFFAYREFMRFHYFVKDNQLFNNLGGVVIFLIKIHSQLEYADTFRGMTPQVLSEIMETFLGMTVESLNRRASKKISYDRVYEFLVALDNMGSLRKELDARTVGHFVQELLKWWMGPGSDQTVDVTISKALYFEKMYRSWVQRQQIVNELFFNKDIKSVSLRGVEKQMKNNPKLKEWIQLFNSVSTHQWRDNGLMFLSKKINDMSYVEMTVSNSIFLLAEFFLKPYNRSATSPFDFKLTKDQTQKIYKTLRILAVPLGIMDSRLLESGYRVFNEGNNFSTQLRNDQFLDFFETYEYLSFALSSFNLAGKTYKSVGHQCRLDYVDVHGDLVLDSDCFLEHLEENFNELVNHLDIVKYVWTEADKKQKKDIFQALKYIAKEGFTIFKTPYQSGELRVMSIFLYYVESIFFNFDYNRDFKLNGTDLINSYNHFEFFLSQLVYKKISALDRDSFSAKTLRYFCDVGDQVEEMVECLKPKLFVYLLTEGHSPDEGFLDQVDFLKDIVFYDDEEIFYKETVSTINIFEFFALLNKDSYESYKSEVADFLLKNKGSLASELYEDRDTFECVNGHEDSAFCQWSRIIRCNKGIEPYLYQWMNENKYSIFPERTWEESPEEAVVETMDFFSRSFVFHKRFSVHCYFPQYMKE